MAIMTIIVENKEVESKDWAAYVSEYDRETSMTSSQDMVGLGTPIQLSGNSMEQVLDEMGKAKPGGIALLFAHASPNGLIMQITEGSYSAYSKYLRGISRAWKAMDEIIALRSGDWTNPNKPVFLIDLPKAVTLFKNLLQVLTDLGGSGSGLGDPTSVKNREQADKWFDTWVGLMAKACLGKDLGETDLRRVCRAMQKVRSAKFERVEFRACNIGKDKENLDALKEFFGTKTVIAPKVTMFFGKVTINLPRPGDQGNLDLLAKDLGGYRGTKFTPMTTKNKEMQKLNTTPGGEEVMKQGQRNRIFPEQNPVQAIMQMTELRPYHYKGRLFITPATANKFFQATYKANYTFSTATTLQPVGGMWTGKESKSPLPFVLPLEASYRGLLESSS